uniref:Uncharacterized protein n=1 Tax=Ananas comosus var. bracteatus TaxID=296719 RepID=A0A6V7NNQ4_ANACO|nr:unnamed protein product [Ananas comosus var. bracteatus]
MIDDLATGLGVLAGAAVLVKSALERGSAPTSSSSSSWPRCGTCGGTGRVTCVCARWSDGDVGCGTCAGSGRMACRSCGGSGSGRPVPAHLPVRPNRRPYQ